MKEHENFKSAVERYQSAAGDLFKPVSKKRSSFEKGAWLLHDKTGELVAIVNSKDVIFGANIWAFMLQSAG